MAEGSESSPNSSGKWTMKNVQRRKMQNARRRKEGAGFREGEDKGVDMCSASGPAERRDSLNKRRQKD